MSIWKDTISAKPGSAPAPLHDNKPAARNDSDVVADFSPAPVAAAVPKARPEAERARKESVIAADLTIEGKIEGTGNVRIAGKFKGDVNVQGDLTIEAGAKVSGGVRAHTVVIAGELEGNIEGAARVELQPSGAITGDVKAGSLTVAAGARMRGQAVFGWEDDQVAKSGAH